MTAVANLLVISVLGGSFGGGMGSVGMGHMGTGLGTAELSVPRVDPVN